MTEIDPGGAAFYTDVVQRQGWNPLVCISMEHGVGNYSHHLYALSGEGGEEQIGCFVFSNNQSLIRNRVTLFDSEERACRQYTTIADIVRLAHVPHRTVALTELDIPEDRSIPSTTE